MSAKEFIQKLAFWRSTRALVPVVRLDGVVGRAGRLARGLSLTGVEDAIEKAFGMTRASAVAVVVNSPGGSPVQSRLIHDRIRALAEEKQKRVLVFCEDVAASGGYMLACSGDEIFADESSLIGSIGVIGAGFGAHEALAKLGLERRVYTAGKHKLRLDPFQPEREGDRTFVHEIQGAIHESFIALVQSRRRDKLDEDSELFEGDVWTGLEAVRLGLIDATGHLPAVLREKFGEDVQIKKIPAAKQPLGARLLGGGADTLLASIEDRISWARFGL